MMKAKNNKIKYLKRKIKKKEQIKRNDTIEEKNEAKK